MMNLNSLKLRDDIIDCIDWDMTPEDAIKLYLEWGNNWSNGKYVIRSKNDISYYFVINNWSNNPLIYLIKRNEDGAKELAKIKMPDHMITSYNKQNGTSKGVFSLDSDIKKWLKKELLI